MASLPRLSISFSKKLITPNHDVLSSSWAHALAPPSGESLELPNESVSGQSPRGTLGLAVFSISWCLIFTLVGYNHTERVYR